MLNSKICCRCFGVEVAPKCEDVPFGLEVVPQCKYVRCVSVVLVSKRCFSAKVYDLLPLLWSRSGAPMQKNTICCRCFGLEVVPRYQEVRFVAAALVSKWCPSGKMDDLLPLLRSPIGAPQC